MIPLLNEKIFSLLLLLEFSYNIITIAFTLKAAKSIYLKIDLCHVLITNLKRYIAIY